MQLVVNRVMLRLWGFNGTLVPGSVNASGNTFQMQVNGSAGLLVPQTVTVYVAGPTAFRNAVSGLSTVPASINVRVVGLLLKDPISGQTVLLAHYVDGLTYAPLLNERWKQEGSGTHNAVAPGSISMEGPEKLRGDSLARNRPWLSEFSKTWFGTQVTTDCHSEAIRDLRVWARVSRTPMRNSL